MGTLNSSKKTYVSVSDIVTLALCPLNVFASICSWFSFYCCCCCLETSPCLIAQTGLEIVAIFLCQSCKCRDSRRMAPHAAVHVSLFWVPCPFYCYVSSVTISPYSCLCGYFLHVTHVFGCMPYCYLMVILVHSFILQIFINTYHYHELWLHRGFRTDSCSQRGYRLSQNPDDYYTVWKVLRLDGT